MWYMATRTRENRRLAPWPRACAGRCAALCDVRRLRRTGCQRSGPGPRERLRGVCEAAEGGGAPPSARMPSRSVVLRASWSQETDVSSF